jgi:hypothetical protein
MTVIDSIGQQLNLFGGGIAFFLFLIASIQLHRTARSAATLTFLLGMVVASAALLGQKLIPFPDPAYIMDGEEIVGATGAFPESWIYVSSAFYLGLFAASIGLALHVFAIGRTVSKDID